MESNVAQNNESSAAAVAAVQETFLGQLKNHPDECITIDVEQEKKIGLRFFLLFMLNGFLNVILTVIQVIYTSKTENLIYFLGCFMFGPLHILAVLLAVSINFCSKVKTKESLALWSIRVLLMGFIPFIIIAVLNTLFIMQCNETKLPEDCDLIVYNISILSMALVCICLDSFFYFIYKSHF